MNPTFIWNSINNQEQKDYIENKIQKWVDEDKKLHNNQSLTITLSMTDPLDMILNGNIKNEKQNTIYKFQSNEFLDNMTITNN